MAYDTDMYETDEGAALVFTDDGYCYFGTGRDMYFRWDGDSFNIVPAAADSVIELGSATYPPDLKLFGGDADTYVYFDNDGGSGSTGEWAFGVNDHGVDVKFYGATASAYMLWDESANALDFSGVASIQATQTPAAADNWGVNQFSVTAPGSSKSIRGLRVNVTAADGGITVGDTQAIHGRVTISADDTTANTSSQNAGFFWLILENGVTNGTGTNYAGVRSIISPGTNDLRFQGDSAALFYGQTWATAGQIDAGVFISAGATSTIRSAFETGGSGTFTQGLNFATAGGNDGDTAWVFAAMPTTDDSSRHMKVFVGDSVTRAAVEAEYQTDGAANGYAGKGTIYISSGGEMYIKVNDVGAATDWEVFAHSAADTG